MKRLSNCAQQIMKLAEEAATEYCQSHIGTEHLLLGIIREGTSRAAQILTDHGATEYRAKSMIDELSRERIDETWVTGRMPGSPHYMDVFGRADRIAERLGHSLICPEHLLAGLLTQTGSVGWEVLRALGISFETVKNSFREQAPAVCA